MYIYPDNLKAKGQLWLWELKSIAVIGIGGLLSVFTLTHLGIFLPAIATAIYAFLSIRFEETSILDFIKNAVRFLITGKQYYEWRLK